MSERLGRPAAACRGLPLLSFFVAILQVEQLQLLCVRCCRDGIPLDSWKQQQQQQHKEQTNNNNNRTHSRCEDGSPLVSLGATVCFHFCSAYLAPIYSPLSPAVQSDCIFLRRLSQQNLTAGREISSIISSTTAHLDWQSSGTAVGTAAVAHIYYAQSRAEL